MKRFLAIIMLTALVAQTVSAAAWAGEMDVLVRKLVEKKILTEDDAKSIMEETRNEVAKESSKVNPQAIPEWTQKVTIKGDVRARTEAQWGKGLNPAHSRVRERIRARVGVETKINDNVTAGARLVTGGTADPRSTNITLGDSTTGGDFSKTTASFDQYYIKLEPSHKELAGTKLWLGKFPNPFETTEFMWDPDINPEGLGLQYSSPFFGTGNFPETRLYANGGIMWLLEIARADTDPMLWGAQAGIISKIYPDTGATINLAAAFYDVTRMKNRNWANAATANTNSLQTLADSGFNTSRVNTLKYDYHPVDLIVRLDNKRILGFDIPHGIYGDLVYNPCANNDNTGYMLGGYLGERSIKEFGQWNVWCEWRYLGRDCVPDILPDSDFYGFTVAGAPAGGGTNTKGIVTGFQFGLFKNTNMAVKYFWTEPIKSSNAGQGTASTSSPYQVVMADVNVKF